MSINRDLGVDYLRRNFEFKWFPIRENGITRIMRYVEDVNNSVFHAQELEGDFNNLTWSTTKPLSWNVLEDMEAFSFPDLGFRHTPDGKLVYLVRPLTTARGINDTLIQTQGPDGMGYQGRLNGAKLAWLVYNDEYVPFTTALARLKAEPNATGFAMSHQFAVARPSPKATLYNLYYCNKLVGTTSPEGVFSIVSVAAKRLFEKVA